MGDASLAQLLTYMAGGDKAAFAEFYRQLEKPVFRFIAKKLNDPVEANDILHEVFMDVWRSAGKFEGRSKVKTWVFGIAYRKTMDHFRKYSRLTVTDEMPDLADDSSDANTCLAASQEAEHLKFCMDGLKPEHRTVIDLAFYEDMTYGEISKVANVPEGTIKTRIFHAKKLLLRCLSGRMERTPS
ncbi:RNA polymerase ECF-type sigma factor [hydrothermal vent metagenome]|uniref:RNA polymerase ECF-type sigma factor n=1 Tax=hydrothermal vent metagenome TaxID=652676 RepID=A0A3B0S1D8_9ZZZZ